MMKMKKIAALLAIAAASGSAFATDGYFAHGYGMKAKGMGGAATAMASDAMGGANNPASMVWAGDRLDIGLDLFAPKRSISRTGSGAVGIDGSSSSGSNLFYVPEFGYNKMMGWDMSAGITVYGNGGMNTDYQGGELGNSATCGTGAGGFNQASQQAGPYNLLCGAGKLGMNLEQLIIAPTFAMKVNKQHSFGGSLLIGYQKFRAYGLSSFYGYTPNAANPYATNNFVSDRGDDTSWGYGLKFGWMGKVSDTVTLGASYTTKMKMKKFSKYKDLFAEEGDFDMPESLNLGIAVKATPALTIAADYQRINYGDVKSVANSSRMPLDPAIGPGGAGIANSLGCSTCRGFGWGSVDVVKLGVEYQYSPNLVLRAGYNHTDNPIKSRDVTFNMIAPGVVQDHVTLGFTYNVSKDSELTMSYMHAYKNSVSGLSLFNSWTGGTAVDKIEMSQDSLGIAYGMKF
ncbi:MAG: outer membrane protein transport protein [Sulfuritalea sp.]|jgi:long-chain fatty acid transport protein|nr:outer membrane protein transport protein [Sulfuritalea sp.]